MERSYSGGMPLPALVPPGPALRREQVERYSRHLLLDALGEVGQRRLLAAKVAVVGAGGLGSPVLQYLAAAGVGTIGVVDHDVVAVSNLQRQVVHTEGDVGRPKVDSAAEHVQGLNPDVRVVRHRVELDATNARDLLSGYDVVLDGTDNFPTRYLVNDICDDLGRPLVWGSILRFDAQVSVFWSRPPGERYPAVTLRDLFPAPPAPGTTPSCGQAGVLGAMCGQVGSLMAAEAVKLITGSGEPLLGRVAVLDVLAARWSEVPLRPRPARRLPATIAELGYDPRGTPVTRAAAPLSSAPGAAHADADALPEITAPALAARLAGRDRGEEGVVVLDVRDAAERSIVTIPGTVHVPLAQLLAAPAETASAAGASPGDRVVVHCLSGGRSAQAQAALRGAGYTDVANLAGGVRAWVEQVDPSLPTY